MESKDHVKIIPEGSLEAISKMKKKKKFPPGEHAGLMFPWNKRIIQIWKKKLHESSVPLQNQKVRFRNKESIENRQRDFFSPDTATSQCRAELLLLGTESRSWLNGIEGGKKVFHSFFSLAATTPVDLSVFSAPLLLSVIHTRDPCDRHWRWFITVLQAPDKNHFVWYCDC